MHCKLGTLVFLWWTANYVDYVHICCSYLLSIGNKQQFSPNFSTALSFMVASCHEEKGSGEKTGPVAVVATADMDQINKRQEEVKYIGSDCLSDTEI